MEASCYMLPLRLDRITEFPEMNLACCSEIQSIDQHLELLITTCPGEHKFDMNYGSKIWELDFERMISKKQWEECFIQYLKESVITYETRLQCVEVNVVTADVPKKEMPFANTSIKKKVDIHITGIVANTSEKCSFYYCVYLGPLTSE